MNYFINKGVKIKGKFGMYKPGLQVKAEHFSGGQEVLDALVKKDKIIASEINPFLSPEERAKQQRAAKNAEPVKKASKKGA